MKNQSRMFILTCIIFSLCVSFLLQCSHRVNQARADEDIGSSVIEASDAPVSGE